MVPATVFIVILFLIVGITAVALTANFKPMTTNEGSYLELNNTLAYSAGNYTSLLKVDDESFTVLSEAATGNKKALLFGLNYINTSNELKGCIDDVRNVSQILQECYFNDIQILTDETSSKPTTTSMKVAIINFFTSLQEGDMGILWFSGHGTLLQNGANAWVPLDFVESGFVSELWILEKMQIHLKKGVRLIVGSDSCHSGSMLNLKYDVEPTETSLSMIRDTTFSMQEHRRKETIVLATQHSTPKNHADFVDDSSLDRLRGAGQYSLFNVFPSMPSLNADVVVIAGCTDSGTSADAYLEGQNQGAMTYSFCKVLRTLKGSCSLGVLQDKMRMLLQSGGYSQVPQLSIGSNITPNSLLRAFGFEFM
jgi:hypothetical protein